jgi:hypothetical protein
MKITADLLVLLSACFEHRYAFAAAFPDGICVTGEPDPAVIACVVDAEMDVGWLCRKALTAAADLTYREAAAAARRTYEVSASQTYRAYREALAVAAWRLLANPENIKPKFRQEGA